MKRFINLEELKLEKIQMNAVAGGCKGSHRKKYGPKKQKTCIKATIPLKIEPVPASILTTMRYAIIAANKSIDPKL